MEALTIGGQVAQLVEHDLSKQKVASSNPSSAWSWIERRWHSAKAKGLIGSMDGTRDWGHMPSMINLPAYLHLCKSTEALVSGVACYRLSRN